MHFSGVNVAGLSGWGAASRSSSALNCSPQPCCSAWLLLDVSQPHPLRFSQRLDEVGVVVPIWHMRRQASAGEVTSQETLMEMRHRASKPLPPSPLWGLGCIRRERTELAISAGANAGRRDGKMLLFHSRHPHSPCYLVWAS